MTSEIASPSQNDSSPSSEAASAELDAAHFREAMSRIVTAVHVVTTDGPAGRVGATISAVCSVSDEPASILVCVNRSSRAHAAILANRVFCVNTLHETHKELSDAFAGRGDLEMGERFAQGTWQCLATGCPGLESARLSVDCELYSVTDMGSHSVIIGTVADLRMNEPDRSLLYVRRGYHSLEK